MRPKGSAEVLAARRRRALELVDEGLSLNEVARRISCQASSVMRWRDRRDQVGEKVYEVGASPGRPPKLSPAQRRRLVRLIAKGPLAHGYNTDIWTCDRVRRLIWRSASTSWRLSAAIRTTPAPASARALAWATVASTSVVLVAHMLCITIGFPSPMTTEPTRTARVGFLTAPMVLHQLV